MVRFCVNIVVVCVFVRVFVAAVCHYFGQRFYFEFASAFVWTCDLVCAFVFLFFVSHAFDIRFAVKLECIIMFLPSQ